MTVGGEDILVAFKILAHQKHTRTTARRRINEVRRSFGIEFGEDRALREKENTDENDLLRIQN